MRGVAAVEAVFELLVEEKTYVGCQWATDQRVCGLATADTPVGNAPALGATGEPGNGRSTRRACVCVRVSVCTGVSVCVCVGVLYFFLTLCASFFKTQEASKQTPCVKDNSCRSRSNRCSGITLI